MSIQRLKAQDWKIEEPRRPTGAPAVHTPRFSVTPGPVSVLTFYGMAGCEVDKAPEFVPAFSAALTTSDLNELREMLSKVLVALQPAKPAKAAGVSLQ